MDKFKNFLKTFISPTYARKQRYMSLFIALLIFVFEALVLYAPINTVLLNKKEVYSNSSIYTKAIYNVSDDYDMTNIQNSHYTITKTSDGYVLTSTIENEDIKKYQYTYVLDNNTVNVYLVFDVNDKLYCREKEIIDQYMEAYPSDGEEKAVYSGMIAVVDESKGLDVNERLAYYHSLSLDEVIVLVKNRNYKEMYQIPEEDNTYCIVFNSDYYYLEIPKSLKDKVDNGITIGQKYDNILVNDNTLSSFIRPFVMYVSERILNAQSRSYILTLLLNIILFPLIVSFIIYLFLHKRGSLKTFGEYYNILAISSVVPCLIAFALTWLIATYAQTIYVLLLLVFGIYMLYRSNAIKDL